MKPKHQLQFKIVHVGDFNSGKTSFFQAYTQVMSENTFLKTLQKGKYEIELKMWDTLGKEEYTSLCSFYYQYSNAELFMIDLSNENSLEDIDEWFNLTHHCHPRDISKKPIQYLIGTKCDLEQKIDDKMIENICLKYNVKYFKTSSLKNIGIEECMNELVDDIMKKFVKNENENKNENKKNKNGCLMN